MNDVEHTIETAFKKIPCSAIAVGVRFSDAVFFDDGESMFLAPGKPAKEYHVACLSRWKIPFLLSCGRLLGDDEPYIPPEPEEVLEEIEEVEEADDLVALEACDAEPALYGSAGAVR